ncbi:hypothetical protein CDO73_01335 [Saccharibacillus sp. O23]|uniref:4'-phosphopantetheinyl transferase family protein n=1 Tax=Saccharibacillus sp. O23 TaxID=2009338 RepID=UPI000B4E2005|nr:4'-phosphopantetheinyl transferase superfamily protein [Saccharibacillus sp. O23]OWR33176.1 hypothetical protein CDO73_01335 [Saccharibacillus sp. O23]
MQERRMPRAAAAVRPLPEAPDGSDAATLIVSAETGRAAEDYEAIKRETVAACLNLAGGAVPPFEFARTPSGKPYVRWTENAFAADLPGAPHISISHSGSRWVMAASANPVGIDVEQKRGGRMYQEGHASFFHPEEQSYLSRRPWELSRVWSAKESYLKLLGVGIFGDTAFFSVIEKEALAPNVGGYPLRSLPLFEECHLLLCGGGPLIDLKRIET